VRTLTAQRRAAWDAYVAEHPDSSVFHTLGWRDAVAVCFPHEDIYLLAERDGRVVGVLPMFLLRSRLAGRILVSVPYGVGGGVLSDDDEAINDLFGAAREIARRRDCRSIDFRSEKAVIDQIPTSDRYVGFSRELPDRPEDILGWLPRKARAAARNGAEKFGLTAHYGDDHLDEVWRLYTLNMRRLASIAYPRRFLRGLIERLPHWVCVARRGGGAVAGLVTFLHRDRVLPYFFGATDKARECSAANFLYASTMQRGVVEGYRVYDFGRSRRDNAGSFDFKRFHGFEPRPLGYQRLVLGNARAADLTPTNPAFTWVRRVWPRLPLRLSQGLGALLSKHVPG
jgi:FemAB-related protein (PEP-CTERM system-associated)